MVGSGDEKEDEDLDGVPLDGAALLKSAFMRGIPGAAGSNDSPSLACVQDNADSDYEDDIDGIPRKCISPHCIESLGVGKQTLNEIVPCFLSPLISGRSGY